MTVTRDFIPEGAEMTPEEARANEVQRRRYVKGVMQDFIPDPGYKPAKRLSREEEAQKAYDAADKWEIGARKRDFEGARQALLTMDIGTAIETLSKLPLAQQELFIVAESSTQNRTSVLQHFPAPSPEAVLRYKPLIDPHQALEPARAARRKPATKTPAAPTPTQE